MQAMTTIPHEPRPIAVFLKGHEIFGAIAAGRSTIAEIADATGFPPTTVLRVAALLVDDRIITAHIVGDSLRLTMTYRGPAVDPT
jgi:DNA-binding IclR family transcriptional regulator